MEGERNLTDIKAIPAGAFSSSPDVVLALARLGAAEPCEAHELKAIIDSLLAIVSNFYLLPPLSSTLSYEKFRVDLEHVFFARRRYDVPSPNFDGRPGDHEPWSRGHCSYPWPAWRASLCRCPGRLHATCYLSIYYENLYLEKLACWSRSIRKCDVEAP